MPGGPLGGNDADQQLAAQWADKVKQWDGNLFLAANGGAGEHTRWPCVTLVLKPITGKITAGYRGDVVLESTLQADNDMTSL